MELKKKKKKLSSHSYRYRALPSHPSHEEHRAICKQYSEEIWKAKQAHLHEFLKYAVGHDIWVANQYISGPGSDRGKSRILTLLLGQTDSPPGPGSNPKVVTNEEKSCTFIQTMFPCKPAHRLITDHPCYPSWLPMQDSIMEAQVWRHLSKLSPHKAMGTNEIPNVSLKETTDVILPYLQLCCRYSE